VLMCSATFDGAVSKLARDIQRDPVIHEIGPQGPDITAARHVFWRVDRTQRAAATADAIKAMGSTIVFCRTRHGADRLSNQLDKLGVTATPIHGGRSQPQRDRALRAFARGEVSSLIATDVAARGVHVDGVAGVVHFDPPQDAATYVHRSGRTARAGATGVVVSLVEQSATHSARRLQREIGINAAISHVDLDALNDTPVPHDPPAPAAPDRARGVVKFFNGGRGYGFIERGSGVDLFVHHSSLRAGASLPIGATVEFAVREGRKGDEAHEVTLV
jgi:superfamily II DNA/RNA helicase